MKLNFASFLFVTAALFMAGLGVLAVVRYLRAKDKAFQRSRWAELCNEDEEHDRLAWQDEPLIDVPKVPQLTYIM